MTSALIVNGDAGAAILTRIVLTTAVQILTELTVVAARTLTHAHAVLIRGRAAVLTAHATAGISCLTEGAREAIRTNALTNAIAG